MFNTGKRTIFEVLTGHENHKVDIINVTEGDMIIGVELYCRTCSFALIQQFTENPIPDPMVDGGDETVCWDTAEAVGWET